MVPTSNSDRSPEFAEAVSLAENSFKNGDYDQALIHYAKAEELDPLYAEGFCNSGIIYAHKGEYIKAESNLMKSILPELWM